MKILASRIQHYPGIAEAIIWLAALIALAAWQPSHDGHFSFCLLNALGFEHCPGCGLGRSISYLLHGDFSLSWQMHWLGIPATSMLSWRIISVFRRIIIQKHKTR